MPFPKRPLELYAQSTDREMSAARWREIIETQHCPFLDRRCFKTRKSQPDMTIGTCIVGYQGQPIVICPARFLQGRQIFLDAIHLLEDHVPGNQLHVVPEITIPGGSVDFFLVSVRREKIQDYLALEIQTLDTTGTVWPARQRLIGELLGQDSGAIAEKSYGMNWKMTAKTILVQMHHKVETLELLGKKLVLVIQDAFYEYMAREFSTTSLRPSETADAAHFHVYSLHSRENAGLIMEMTARHSTTTLGIEQMLGLRHNAEMPEQDLLSRIQSKIGEKTLLKI